MRGTQEKKVSGIKTLTEFERDVYVFALRYALPRHTYALSIVAGEIIAKIDSFEDWELENMARDAWIYYPSADMLGEIDQKKANEFYGKMLAELLKRGRDDMVQHLRDEAERRGMDERTD